MDGGWFSKGDSRRNSAYIRLKSLQLLQGWSAAPFRHVAVVWTPLAMVLSVCNNAKDSCGCSPRNGSPNGTA
eukprot:4604647-Pyramimonas_sp.AAC.1